MIQGDHEDAPGQIELNFNFDRAERTADNLSTFRQVCRQVGRELNAFPCFMPKPFMGVSANGCHHNISLWRGDENAFMPETDDQQLPSQIGLWAIGGILEHLGALTAVTSPTVNSYRRLWDTGFWAPVFADWGFQNRTTALRVSAPGPVRVPLRRLLRQPVPLDGRADHGDVGRHRPQARSGRAGGAEHLRGDGGRQEVKKIPMTFGDALDALEADEVVKKALPGEMYTVFMHYKRDEWERFCATVTDWDVNEYLDILP